MKIIILPLGTIIRTDFTQSIRVFQGLADGLQLKVNVATLLPILQPIFRDFNLGRISNDEFIQQFCSILPIDNKDFLPAWNAMCVMDDSTLELMRFFQIVAVLPTVELQFCFYSDTNPLHVEYLNAELQKQAITVPSLYTTFSQQLPKDQLLTKLIQIQRATKPNTAISVMIGNSDAVTETLLQKELQARDQAVESAADDIQIIKLAGPYLTFADLIQKIEISLPLKLALLQREKEDGITVVEQSNIRWALSKLGFPVETLVQELPSLLPINQPGVLPPEPIVLSQGIAGQSGAEFPQTTVITGSKLNAFQGNF